jgi:hypothetical protein
VRAFNEAIERQERLRWSAQFSVLLTSFRGERDDIKQLLKLLE